jgi:tetratricopeptide (TPR) repeat protein
MNNPLAENLYERLDLPSDASEGDIKRAFFSAVREFPPEKDAENYKLIRAAYDTLINSQSRQEYDARDQYGPEVIALEAELEAAREAENTHQQVRVLKKLINLFPEIGRFRNQLGLAFLNDEEHDTAADQFMRACEIDPKNSTYHLNLGFAYRRAESYTEARECFERTIELDPEDYEGPRALADMLFMDLKEKQEAHRVLDKAILADDKVDFQDFFCMHDKLFMYVLDHDDDGIRQQCTRIQSVASGQEEKEFASFSFAKMAAMVSQYGNYDVGHTLASAAAETNPADTDICEFRDGIQGIALIQKEMRSVLGRDDCPGFLKFAIVTMFQSEFEDEDDEITEQMETIKRAFPRLIDTDPASSDIKRTARMIRDSHPHLWEWREKLWDSFLSSGPAGHFQLICVRCKNTANADKHSVDMFKDGDIYPSEMGLSCPDCRSDGPFVIAPSSYSGESEDAAVARAKRSTPSRASSARYAAAAAATSSSSSSWCFIATAVYGDNNHVNVHELRSFRDQYLLPSPFGQRVVEAYYRLSPPIADWLSGKKQMAAFVRVAILNPLVAVVRKWR